MKTGIELIAKERQEQIEKHGWTLEHDSQVHCDGALRIAAMFALTLKKKYEQVGFEKFEKKVRSKSYEQRLIIAGALTVAELDRVLEIDSMKKIYSLDDVKTAIFNYANGDRNKSEFERMDAAIDSLTKTITNEQ